MNVDSLFASRYGQAPPELGGSIVQSLTGVESGGESALGGVNQMLQDKLKAKRPEVKDAPTDPAVSDPNTVLSNPLTTA